MSDVVVDATIEVVFALLDAVASDDVQDAKRHLSEVAKDVVARTFG